MTSKHRFTGNPEMECLVMGICRCQVFLLEAKRNALRRLLALSNCKKVSWSMWYARKQLWGLTVPVLVLVSFILAFLRRENGLFVKVSVNTPSEWSAVGHLRESIKSDDTTEYRLDSFIVSVDRFTRSIRVAHSSDPDRFIWMTSKGQDFIQAGRGKADIDETRGLVTVSDRLRALTNEQTITSVVLDHSSPKTSKLTVTGKLLRRKRFQWKRTFWRAHTTVTLDYKFCFETTPDSDRHLAFSVELLQEDSETKSDSLTHNRVILSYYTTPDENFHGFGEQFTHFNMKGRAPTIVTSENGLGRRHNRVLHSTNVLFNIATRLTGTAGKYDHSYAPVPHYITNHGRSIFLENYEISVFDLTDPNKVTIKLHAPKMKGRIVYGKTPLELIEAYTAYSGRMQPLPAWLNKGAVVGMQGGTAKVRHILRKLRDLQTPIAAFWLQDWVGERQTRFGSQLWWNWVLDKRHYPDWTALLQELRSAGARVMTYISPFLVDVNKDPNYKGQNLYREAKEAGYLVQGRDGQPSSIPNTDFSAGLVDLTNEDARNWIKSIIKKNVLGVGASGWMCDFGEALPFDSVLSSGESPESYHNKYPEEWAAVNKEAIEEADKSGDAVFFSRSAFTKSPGITPLFWQGDQMVLWDSHDGLKSVITGLLSSGLSGFSLNHNDIGGYTSFDKLGMFRIRRSRELLMRWTEMNAFTSVFRTHEGIQPDKNVQFYTDEGTLAHFSRFAKVYAALAPYRDLLMRQAAKSGFPVVRHPLLHYPSDQVTYELKYQWMLGSDIMVAPVTEPGISTARVYLPEATWVHAWTDKVFEGPDWVTIDAPIGYPAVFVKNDSVHGADFLRRLKDGQLLESSPLSSLTSLHHLRIR